MMIIIFRVIYVFVLIVIIFILIFCNINRMKGKIFTTVNGEEYALNYIGCRYERKEVNEKITYESSSSGLTFKNKGGFYGMYEYSFDISNDEISITPKIYVFKTNWWEIYNINMDVAVYKEGKMWNADISVDVNGYTYHEIFYDVENNAIEYRVE